jgi:hypothetical protein
VRAAGGVGRWSPCALAAALAAGLSASGCSLGGDEKKPPKPRGPVAAVILGADGQRRASVQADGAVEQAAADGSGGWFVSGQFSNIGGYDRGSLAHIEADGDVDPDWDPVLDRSENSPGLSARFAVGNGKVYLAGDFASVDRKPRNGGAAIDAESGEVDPGWAPKLGIVTDAIALTPEHVLVATGGRVDAYDPSSGQADTAFRLRTTPDTDDVDDGVDKLVPSGARVYVGGTFKRVNGMRRPALARVDARTGRLDRTWNPPRPGGPVSDLTLTPSTVYAVVDFFKTGPARPRGGLAAFDANGSGRLVPSFRPPRPGRTFDGYEGGRYTAVATLGSRVFAGGDFGGAPTHGFATLDARSGAILPSWHPAGRPELIKLVVPSGTGVLVTGDKLGP